MGIKEIWWEIFGIECDLIGGRTNFSYDNQMCAMKPGHPGEILESIIIDVGAKVLHDEEEKISLEELETMAGQLKTFMEGLHVFELKHAIEELEKYIDNQKNIER